MQITIEIIEEYNGYKVGDKITFEIPKDGIVQNVQLFDRHGCAVPTVYKLVKHPAIA